VKEAEGVEAGSARGDRPGPLASVAAEIERDP